jgi:glycosyltransferase involved in cell wall biosynthesis
VNNMRILHVISGIDPRNGGPTNALIGLTAAQVRAGLEVRVASTWQEEDAFRSAERLKQLGVGVRMIGPAHGKLSRHPDIVGAMEQELEHADVLHVHAVWEEIEHQACRAAWRMRVPYVFTPHGMLDPWNMRKRWLLKQLYLAMRMRRNLDNAALLHFTTEIERDWVARMHLSPPTLVESLGLDWSEFANLPPRDAFRSQYPQLVSAPIILFLGRIHYGKGLELLIPALAMMRRRDAMLVVAGPDTFGYRREIDQLMARHGVGARVVFTGMIAGEQKLAALVDADLLAMPSYHENFGLAVIEALAAGTPVIVSDQVNLHPQIAAGGVGAVVPMDVVALAQTLDRWLEEEKVRQSAAGAARAFARERFDWNEIARRWVGHYRAVMERHHA